MSKKWGVVYQGWRISLAQRLGGFVSLTLHILRCSLEAERLVVNQGVEISKFSVAANNTRDRSVDGNMFGCLPKD
jgi:hypothetical protein